MHYVIKEYYRHSGEFIGDTWYISSMEAIDTALKILKNKNIHCEVWKVFYDNTGKLKEIKI
jgi:hypothetical protein